MTEQLQFPDSRHNHPPRCCCLVVPELDICPACPSHGELARGVECPQCHQTAGRPHTEYCPLAIREDVFGQTSQPATRTSQPGTQTRELVRTCRICGCTDDNACDLGCHWVGEDLCSSCQGGGFTNTTPLAAPTPHLAGRCSSCYREYDQDPGPTCCTPHTHDHPR